MVKKKKKFTSKFYKKLEESDKLILILKNLMWLREQMRWEVMFSKYRKSEYDATLQKNIEIITEQLLKEVDEVSKIKDEDKFDKDGSGS